MAVGGEGSGGEGQGGAGELCLSFTFFLAFAQITGENGTSGCRTVKAVACLEDPEAIVGCAWTCWIWRGGRSTWVVRTIPAGGARRPEEMLKNISFALFVKHDGRPEKRSIDVPLRILNDVPRSKLGRSQRRKTASSSSLGRVESEERFLQVL